VPKTAKRDLNPDELGRLEQVDPDESCPGYPELALKSRP